jgi:hypothetical protein
VTTASASLTVEDPAGGAQQVIALGVALGAAVVVLGVLLPWLAVAALVTAAALVPVRLARRRAVPAAPAPPQD